MGRTIDLKYIEILVSNFRKKKKKKKIDSTNCMKRLKVLPDNGIDFSTHRCPIYKKSIERDMP